MSIDLNFILYDFQRYAIISTVLCILICSDLITMSNKIEYNISQQ